MCIDTYAYDARSAAHPLGVVVIGCAAANPGPSHAGGGIAPSLWCGSFVAVTDEP